MMRSQDFSVSEVLSIIDFNFTDRGRGRRIEEKRQEIG